MNNGFAYTAAQLEAAVLANTEFTSCPLSHAGPINDFHKEPYIAAAPGSVADTTKTRTVLHIKDPGGIYHTTVVAE